jgi:hypothetical protein
VSSRLRHANSPITMGAYAHMIGQSDTAATEAIERALARRPWSLESPFAQA